MVRRLCLALAPVVAFLAQSALAEGPNLSANPQGGAGSAAQLYLAQRAYAAALVTGEVLPLLAAIRLAREVTLRPATGWEVTRSGEGPAEAVTGGPDTIPDPGGEAALTIARNLAGEDPDLQDLVYDLDAQRPGGRTATAVEVRGDLGPGQTDDWRLPLFGEVAAEIALIGNGDGPLALAFADESGAVVCAQPASITPVLCRVTPARNGFFTLSVHNPGPLVNSYRLIGN